MWDTLTKLFEAKTENRKMALKDKLHSIKTKSDEGVASYLTRVTQVKDDLSESDDEDDAAFDIDDESDSLLSTGRRLIQSSDGEVEQDDGTQVESQMSEFQFEIEHLFSSLIP